MKRIEELKIYSAGTLDFIKKDEQTLLNFYSKKWKDISEESREQNLNISSVQLPNNERTLGLILDLTEQIDKIGGGIGGRK